MTDPTIYEVKVWADGCKEWYPNGKRHRTDGPAYERADGSKSWYLNDQLHRTDGPAFEWANGSKHWYLNGQLHRTDGPACEWADGCKEWYLNGECLTETAWKAAVNPVPTCNGKTVDIDGRTYKLTLQP